MGGAVILALQSRKQRLRGLHCCIQVIATGVDWDQNLDLLAAKSPSAQPPSHSFSQRCLCLEAPLRGPGSLLPSSCALAICPESLPVRAWVPRDTGLPVGRTLPAWLGPAWEDADLCLAPLGTVLVASGACREQTGQGPWGLRLKLGPSHSCCLPELSPHACRGCEGEDVHITAAEIRLGQKSVEDNSFRKKQAVKNP